MTRLFAFLMLALLLLPCQAWAVAGEWQRDADAGARLISGVTATGDGSTVPLGLEIEMGPEWHTYWRSPGAAGLPPEIDWQSSLNDTSNLQSSVMLFPAPKRYTAYGLETVGYRDHVVFPIDAVLHAPGRALSIDATLNLLVCSAICVPKSFALKLTVPAGAAAPSPEATLIKQFRDQLPGDAEKSGLVIKGVANTGAGLSVTVESRDELTSPDIFIEDDKSISFAAPEVTLSEHGHTAVFDVKLADTLPDAVPLAGMPLVLTVVDGEHALENHVIAPEAEVTTGPKHDNAHPLPLALAILFAIIGGFIMNLMPCVLPVLSMKILSVVSHGGRDTGLVRQSFLMTATGIVFSYMALAAMVITLKRLGLAFGWGVQFQQPLFLLFLTLLLTFFAANMWGLFEIQLPRFLADSLDSSYHPKLAGDFATGAFATLLATPCSAPFLGTAVGFALASGPLQILTIFLALGMGMSLPYIAIATWPRVATTLPKPGLWMVRLRQLLGGALALTALWMLWVLAAQIPLGFALFVGLAMLGIVILLCLRSSSVRPRL
nr:copper resistance protein [Pseudomonadota bacterium]